MTDNWLKDLATNQRRKDRAKAGAFPTTLLGSRTGALRTKQDLALDQALALREPTSAPVNSLAP